MRLHSFSLVLALASLSTLAVACGGTAGTDIDDPTNPGSSSGASGSSSGTSGGTSGVVGPGGPTVTLSLRGSKDAVTHKDTLASQTPLRQGVAIRSFYLMKDASDPAPLKVADIGPTSVETDLVSGEMKDITNVPIKSLPKGAFTFAKVGVAYVRYTIAARLHTGGFPTDGTYDNIEALSDNAVIDGVVRKKSWFKSTFNVAGKPVASTENEGAPLPALPDSGGMRLETSGSESFYVFPLTIALDPDYPADMRLVVDVNVHESFRWVDQGTFGYSAKVFDTTPTSYEPVMSFGASAFKVTYEAK